LVFFFVMSNTIFTIGHSTRSLEEFISLLQENKIEVLADVRSYPGSKRFPHFNKEVLAHTLEKENIEYVHLPSLGGRRKVKPDSHNIAWRHEAFRGYADYMETNDFNQGIHELILLARKKNTAYMCSEAVWWRCHRSLISDFLKSKGWKVIHILGKGKIQEHPYTSAATIKNGKLNYEGDTTLFS
jgi:uncharacterized protein (DUF488 family)